MWIPEHERVVPTPDGQIDKIVELMIDGPRDHLVGPVERADADHVDLGAAWMYEDVKFCPVVADAVEAYPTALICNH